jgi:hypothetical protein
MGTIWEISFGVFLLVTVILGGGAAYMTGRAVALTWRTLLHLAVYVVALNCSVRFIHYALFGGTLLSLQYFLVDLVFLSVIAGIGFQTTKTGQMVSQYSWLYERQSPLSWRERPEIGRPS